MCGYKHIILYILTAASRRLGKTYICDSLLVYAQYRNVQIYRRLNTCDLYVTECSSVSCIAMLVNHPDKTGKFSCFFFVSFCASSFLAVINFLLYLFNKFNALPDRKKNPTILHKCTIPSQFLPDSVRQSDFAFTDTDAVLKQKLKIFTTI